MVCPMRIACLVWIRQEDVMATALKTNNMPESEWAARQELAAAYRIFAMMGWDEMIYNHITGGWRKRALS